MSHRVISVILFLSVASTSSFIIQRSHQATSASTTTSHHVRLLQMTAASYSGGDSNDGGDLFNAPDEGTISKGFLPSGPSDLPPEFSELATVAKDEMQQSKRLFKRYFKAMEKIAPNELIQKFAATAPLNVQAACKSTVVNILGSLPNYAVDAALITTSSKLSNLLHQMQITGYMFKNAEYRMSFVRSLKGMPRLPSQLGLTSTDVSFDSMKDAALEPHATQGSGEVMVRTSSGNMVAVNVDDLSSALGDEISALRSELSMIRNEREQELRTNLLTYVQALPDDELAELTSDVSTEILDTIQMLVDTLMERLGIDIKGPDVVIQQNMGAMGQLCMWQMVMGYKLRELEALDRGISLY